MSDNIIDHAASFGPEWFFAIIVTAALCALGKQLLDEYKRQNERKAKLAEKQAELQADLDLKREERKREELNERLRRDRERSEMEGRIAAQMERSNDIQEAQQSSMEALRMSNETLHADIVESRGRSQLMSQKVDHIYDRVDLIYEKGQQQ